MTTHQAYLRISFNGMSLSEMLTKKSWSQGNLQTWQYWNKCQQIMSFSGQVWLVLTLKLMKPMMSLITISNYCGNAALVSQQSEGILDLETFILLWRGGSG